MRRPLAIIAAVVLSLPSTMAVAGGRLDAATAGVRFLVALALCWIGFAMVEHLVTAYTPAAPADDAAGPADATP